MLSTGQKGLARLVAARPHGAGLTQLYIAERVGVAKCTVTRWRSGERTPNDPDVLRKLEALGAEYGVALPIDGWGRVLGWDRVLETLTPRPSAACAAA